MIEINLIPEVKLELIKAQKVRLRVISASIVVGIVSIGVVVALSMYVFGVQTAMHQWKDDEIKKESETLFAKEDLTKVLTIQNQLARISDINSSKMIDSRMFDLLDAIKMPVDRQADVTTVTIDTDNSLVTINGEANNYVSVEVFRKTLSNMMAKYKTIDSETSINNTLVGDSNTELDAETDSALVDLDQQEVLIAYNVNTQTADYGQNTAGATVVRFTISFNYATEFFSPQSEITKIYIMTTGNVTDSYLGMPCSLLSNTNDNCNTATGTEETTEEQ